MRLEEVKNYHDLEEYIRFQLRQQLAISKRLELVLDDVWFFKLHKLIKFYLRHDKSEWKSQLELDESCKIYKVKINKVFTIVTRR